MQSSLFKKQHNECNKGFLLSIKNDRTWLTLQYDDEYLQNEYMKMPRWWDHISAFLGEGWQSYLLHNQIIHAVLLNSRFLYL
jgi:hypothetical protein